MNEHTSFCKKGTCPLLLGKPGVSPLLLIQHGVRKKRTNGRKKVEKKCKM